MRNLSVWVIAGDHGGAITTALRRLLPGSSIGATTVDELGSVSFDALVIQADSNADFARVRAIRRAQPNACVIVVSTRDRSEAAYVSGANEFASCYDHERIAQAINDTLAMAAGAPS